MDIKILLGVVLLMVFVSAIIFFVKKEPVEPTLIFSPEGTEKLQKQQKKEKPSSQFGRFKIELVDGTKKTMVGNLETILDINDVKDYYEIK